MPPGDAAFVGLRWTTVVAAHAMWVLALCTMGRASVTRPPPPPPSQDLLPPPPHVVVRRRVQGVALLPGPREPTSETWGTGGVGGRGRLASAAAAVAVQQQQEQRALLKQLRAPGRARCGLCCRRHGEGSGGRGCAGRCVEPRGHPDVDRGPVLRAHADLQRPRALAQHARRARPGPRHGRRLLAGGHALRSRPLARTGAARRGPGRARLRLGRHDGARRGRAASCPLPAAAAAAGAGSRAAGSRELFGAPAMLVAPSPNPLVSWPGAYRCVCAELLLSGLEVNTVLNSGYLLGEGGRGRGWGRGHRPALCL